MAFDQPAKRDISPLAEWITLFHEIVGSDDSDWDVGMPWWLNDHGYMSKFTDVLLRARTMEKKS